MFPLVKRVFRSFFLDEQAFTRWVRGGGVMLAVGGVAFADQLAGIVGAPGAVKWIKVAAMACGFLGLANAAGQKNDSPEVTAEKLRAVGALSVAPPPSREIR